jgi:Zn-dependent protease
MVAAGPGAGFAFLLAIIAVLGVFFGPMNVISLAAQLLFGLEIGSISPRLGMFLESKPFVFLLIFYLFQINFWWGVINLLPVMPLDGGRIADLFVKPQRRVYVIGFTTAVAMAAFSYLWLGSLYTAALFGFLAWRNYQEMRAVRWQ